VPEPPPGVRCGEVFAGKYRIGDVLGAGAMGTVLAAQHLLLDQRVAIKFLTTQASAHPEALGRFMREARAGVRIKSEHVVRVLDVAVENDVPFIVMEYLEGCDLAEWLRRHGPLPIEDAVDFILQACEAIHEAHGLDVIHRDIKPPNLFAVQHAGVVQTIKVLDFGISKTGLVPPTQGPTEWKPGSVVTEERTMIGSPYYMSPEQMESARDVDARTDVWALGVTLFELLTGRLPFEGRSLLQVYSRIAADTPLHLRDSSPHIPPDLEAVILRCLERERERRCRSVAELATALARFGSNRAMISVERIVRPSGRGETASPDSPANGTRGPQSPAVAAADKTLPSPERVPILPEAKPAERKRPGVRVAVASLLAAVLGMSILLPRMFASASARPAASLTAATGHALPDPRGVGPSTPNPAAAAPDPGPAAVATAGTAVPVPSPAASPSGPRQAAAATKVPPKDAAPRAGIAPGARSASRPGPGQALLDAAASSGAEWTPPEVPR
jgi:eukaryotic-like serine/threonine-protein kinase